VNVADLPQSMTVIEISTPGGPEVLKPVTRTMPAIGAGDVLIRVEASGVNRPDLMQRLGKYPPPPGAPDVPGMEVAGVVAVVGSAVDRWRAGDRVMALVAGGGYAEYCAAPAPQCLPIPRGLTVEEAAGMPETYFTVWTNVFDRGRLASGESLLVHGGTSGIGSTAIQLARARGAGVFATAGSDE
jgi:NADPH:quinone reductase-like Zn-dependent oxidoreductase